MWFLLLLLILLFALSGGGWYGYRAGYYTAGPAYGLIFLFIVLFLIMALFAAPRWGYYPYFW